MAFSAILPLMTVVNYSVQDTFGNNQFFWNGVGWFKELLDPRPIWAALLRLAVAQPVLLRRRCSRSRCRSASWSRCRCRARAGGVAACLVMMALPLLIPWNVVGTIWQIFGRTDIGLLGYVLNSIGHQLQLRRPTSSTPGSPSS